jgi:hypothetical protein
MIYFWSKIETMSFEEKPSASCPTVLSFMHLLVVTWFRYKVWRQAQWQRLLGKILTCRMSIMMQGWWCKIHDARLMPTTTAIFEERHTFACSMWPCGHNYRLCDVRHTKASWGHSLPWRLWWSSYEILPRAELLRISSGNALARPIKALLSPKG